jgi:hypothetical protein
MNAEEPLQVDEILQNQINEAASHEQE